MNCPSPVTSITLLASLSDIRTPPMKLLTFFKPNFRVPENFRILLEPPKKNINVNIFLFSIRLIFIIFYKRIK